LTLAGLNGALFPQLASMLGAPLGGWFADLLRRKRAGGRILVQAIGVLGVCPFVVICGQTDSLTWCLLALTAWGLFKGIYDANIFASVFDVVRPESRGTIAGWMNMVGWLLGGAPAPVVIGYLADRYGLGNAISCAAVVYLTAAILLAIAGLVFVSRDLPEAEIDRG